MTKYQLFRISRDITILRIGMIIMLSFALVVGSIILIGIIVLFLITDFIYGWFVK